MGTTLLNYYLFPAPETQDLVSGVQGYFRSEGYIAVSEKDTYDVHVKVCERKGSPAFIGLPVSDFSNLDGYIT